ncbi:hypothetical protein [Maribacter sp. IgM3_T14_3]|uniref:hypothetical protein n=1 Tax=Maribacter sp. IgM3_T14_3 TaxID=3415140 RepID=UPI003C6EAC46
MDTNLIDIIYFVLPLALMGLVVKYAFHIDVSILLPSVVMLLLFVILTICSPFTPKKMETELFTIFCVLQLVALIGGILLMARQEILWKHFFVSLPFQLIYWVLLFYYGGLQFTHKFQL